MNDSPRIVKATTPRGARVIARADYGLDAPNLVRNFAIVGVVLIIFGLYGGFEAGTERWAPMLARIAVWVGVTYLLSSGLMVLSSKVGKHRARDAMLAHVGLHPADTVLDVGCGHGLLLVGAARRVPRGRAVGLDLWSQVDQGNNSRAATLANATAEGVADRVEVHDGDMTAMPFEAESFDAVVSSLAIHNVRDRSQRKVAMEEIARVLKPGGRVAILDIAHVGDYATALRAYGFARVEAPRFSPFIFPPARVLYAVK